MPGAASGQFRCVIDAFNSNKPLEISAPAFQLPEMERLRPTVKLSVPGCARGRRKQASGPGRPPLPIESWLLGGPFENGGSSAEQGTLFSPTADF